MLQAQNQMGCAPDSAEREDFMGLSELVLSGIYSICGYDLMQVVEFVLAILAMDEVFVWETICRGEAPRHTRLWQWWGWKLQWYEWDFVISVVKQVIRRPETDSKNYGFWENRLFCTLVDRRESISWGLKALEVYGDDGQCTRECQAADGEVADLIGEMLESRDLSKADLQAFLEFLANDGLEI